MTRLAEIFLLSLWILNAVDGYTKSNSGLVSVPSNIPTSSTVVILDNNLITQISGSAFASLSVLGKCFLRYNQIRSVHSTAFADTTLRELHLTSNKLTQVPELTVVSDTFAILDISFNLLTDLNGHPTWGDITLLRKVTLDHNTGLSSILPLKNNCARLAYLSLTNTSVVDDLGVMRTCPKLERVIWKTIDNAGNIDTPGMFSGTKIDYIELQNRGMTEFPDFALLGLPTVGFLDIGGNVNITHIPASRLQGVSFSGLKVDRTGLKNIQDFAPIADTIKELSVRYNKVILNNDSFNGFTSLESLKLTGNHLTKFPVLGDAAATLTKLFLDVNSISSISVEDLAPMKAIETLHLQNNDIKGDWNSLAHVAGTLKSLDLSGQGMRCMQAGVLANMTQLTELVLNNQFLDCMFEIPLPPSQFTKIDLTGIQMFCDCCWDWLKSKDWAMVKVQAYPCQALGPDQLKSRSWSSISQRDLKCIQGQHSHECALPPSLITSPEPTTTVTTVTTLKVTTLGQTTQPATTTKIESETTIIPTNAKSTAIEYTTETTEQDTSIPTTTGQDTTQTTVVSSALPTFVVRSDLTTFDSKVTSSMLSEMTSSTGIPLKTTSAITNDMTSNIPSTTTSKITSNIPSKTTSEMTLDTTSELTSEMTSNIPSGMISDKTSGITSNSLSSTTSGMTSKIPTTTTSDMTSKIPTSTTSELTPGKPSSTYSEEQPTAHTKPSPSTHEARSQATFSPTERFKASTLADTISIGANVTPSMGDYPYGDPGFLSWNTWIAWTQCTMSCDGGTKFRIRLCEESAIDDCQRRLQMSIGHLIGYSIDSSLCNTFPCSDIQGFWGPWTLWTDCSVDCGTGTQSRVRTCVMTSDRAYKCPGQGQENLFCEKETCQSRKPFWSRTVDEGSSFKESDHRTSAKSIGGTSILFLLLIFLLIFILDLKIIRDHLCMMLRNIRRRETNR